MVPSAETGPLSEVVHPILSSVAVTPGVSSARAGRASATTPAAAEPASSERRLSEVMASSQAALNPAAFANAAQSLDSSWAKTAAASCVNTLIVATDERSEAGTCGRTDLMSYSTQDGARTQRVSSFSLVGEGAFAKRRRMRGLYRRRQTPHPSRTHCVRATHERASLVSAPTRRGEEARI